MSFQNPIESHFRTERKKERKKKKKEEQEQKQSKQTKHGNNNIRSFIESLIDLNPYRTVVSNLSSGANSLA